MNLRRWFRDHSLRLLAIRDTPEAIAGGVAIGVFFGFPPLFGMKTACAILFAWLARCNILAAVIAVTLHDVLGPFMLVLYRWEYCLGYWLLSTPHHWPQRLSRATFLLRPRFVDWPTFWKTFSTIGRPLFLGSIVFGTLAGVVSFFLTRIIVKRHQEKRRPEPESPASAG